MYYFFSLSVHIFLSSLYDTRQSCIRTCENLSPPLSSGYLEGGDKSQGYLPREAVLSQEAAWNCRGVMVVMAAAGGQADHRLAREGQVLRDSWRQPPTCSFRPVSTMYGYCSNSHSPPCHYIYTHKETYTDHTHIPPIHLITTYKHTEHDHVCPEYINQWTLNSFDTCLSHPD